jgi:hypothetical protein
MIVKRIVEQGRIAQFRKGELASQRQERQPREQYWR